MKKAAIGGATLMVLSGALLWGILGRSQRTHNGPPAGSDAPELPTPAGLKAPPELSPAATAIATAPVATDPSEDCSKNPSNSVTDDALIDAIRAGALHSERCRALLDAELLVRVLRLGCERADFPEVRGLAASCAVQWLRTWDPQDARTVDPLGSLEASTLRCLMRSLATAPPALARTLGTWLATRFKDAVPGTSNELLNALASALLEAHPPADEAWWEECWSGLSRVTPRKFAMRMAVVFAMSTSAPDAVGSFLRGAVRWDASHLSEADRLEALSFYGLAARKGSGAEKFTRDFLLSRDPHLQIIAFTAFPPDLKWPARPSSVLSAPEFAKTLGESATAMAGAGATELAWRTAWWRNDWALLGPQAAAANFHRDLSPGIDRAEDALLRVSYAFMILPMLDARSDLSNEAMLVRRGLREGFNASSDAVLSMLIEQLAAVLNADPDEWNSHQRLLREIVGERAERLTERARRAISTK